MSDWQTVRYNPAWEETLDPELIPLLDAMNAAGFVTTSSCSGHGIAWPHIWFAHSTDERIERLARFVKGGENGDYRPYFTMWQKEILREPNACAWCVEFHLTTCYKDTTAAEMMGEAVKAFSLTTARVIEFRETERAPKAAAHGH